MWRGIALIVLGSVAVLSAPSFTVAEDIPQSSLEEIIEEVVTPAEEIPEPVIEDPLPEPEVILEPVVVPAEPEIPEVLLTTTEDVQEEMPIFNLLMEAEESVDGTVVYDFPKDVWGGLNEANGECRPYLPYGKILEDVDGTWDDVTCDFSRWKDSDTEYTFNTIEMYLSVSQLSNPPDYPLSAGSVSVRIYAANSSWSKGTLVSESLPLEATEIASNTACTGAGTEANPFSEECIVSLVFPDSVTLLAEERYVFELHATGVVSPDELANSCLNFVCQPYHHYPGLLVLGASTNVSPFGQDGIQDAPPSSTGSVYMRLILGDEPPPVEVEAPSVLFLPGFLASRLYETPERKIWEPNGDDDIQDLAMTASGESELPLYVGDVVDTIQPDGIFEIPTWHIHKQLLTWLQNLKETEHQISDWKAYSYDWRYDVFDVIDNGTLREDGSRDYLVDVVEQLASQGPVTIIAHSNGGLLAKALMVRLTEQGKESLVNRIVLIGVPQVGTPQAALALLHGDKVMKPLFTPTGSMRAAAVSMPGAYSLLPSEAFFDKPHSPLASFAEGEATNPYRALISEEITDLIDALAFWKNDPFIRDVPEILDEETPYPLSLQWIEKARDTHALIDYWTPPPHLAIHEIAGWGNDTATGASYITECPLFSCSIDYERKTAADGDNTVLASSALHMGMGVYFNLFSLEQDFDEEGKHENLTESDVVHEYLNYLLGFSTNYNSLLFTLDEPSTDQFPLTKSKVLSVHSPVILSVTDSNGNQSGIFPMSGSDLFYILEDIDNSSVDITGEDKYVSVSSEGDYEVVITGIGTGTATFQIEEYEGSDKISDSAVSGIPITRETLVYVTVTEEGTYSLEVDKDGNGTPDTIIPIQENETVEYQEPTAEIEQGSVGNSSSTKTERQVAKVSESPDSVTPLNNDFLNPPPPPFLQTANETGDDESPASSTLTAQDNTDQADVPAETQTASAYDAMTSAAKWLMEKLQDLWSWILSLFGVQ